MDSDDRIIRAFRKKRARQIILLIPLIVLLVSWFLAGDKIFDFIFKFLKTDIMSNLPGKPLKYQVAGGGVIVLLYIIFPWIDWRCPSCGRHLGRAFNPRYCPKCGVRLQ
jgi:hypothetical protein